MEKCEFEKPGYGGICTKEGNPANGKSCNQCIDENKTEQMVAGNLSAGDKLMYKGVYQEVKKIESNHIFFGMGAHLLIELDSGNKMCIPVSLDVLLIKKGLAKDG